MYFDEIAKANDPGREELKLFVNNVRKFLGSVLKKEEFSFLWDYSPDLLEIAQETFNSDIKDGAGLELDEAIPYIHPDKLKQHGLEGRPLKFKFRVLSTVENGFEVAKKSNFVRGWFEKIIDAIDAILDSLIAAAGGAGGIIKEFKDALRALA